MGEPTGADSAEQSVATREFTDGREFYEQAFAALDEDPDEDSSFELRVPYIRLMVDGTAHELREVLAHIGQEDRYWLLNNMLLAVFTADWCRTRGFTTRLQVVGSWWNPVRWLASLWVWGMQEAMQFQRKDEMFERFRRDRNRPSDT